MKKCNKCKHTLEDKLFSIKENGQTNKICTICTQKSIANYEKRKIKGLCATCGINAPKKNKKNCSQCLSKASEKEKNKRESAILNKKCISCKKRTPSKDNSRCYRCQEKYRLPIKTKIFRNAQSRAKKTNLDFTITEEDLIIPEFCPILNIKLKENKGKSKFDSYSIDRIDNSKGYIPGNIHIISMKANTIKNNSSIEELELLLNYLKSIKNYTP